MPSNGTYATVLAEQTIKKASQASVMKALTNANAEAKKSDPKKGAKAKKK